MAKTREACVRWLAGLAVLGMIVWAGAAGDAQGALPDGRGYELVSAVDKNGGDVMAIPDGTRVAEDGSAASYVSLSNFSDTLGGGVATEYMGVRAAGAGAATGQGWATHGILPVQSALTFQAVLNGFEPRYQHDLSADLTMGVLFAWRPVTNNPFVTNVANLYLRDDLKTPGRGRYTLVTACPVCISPLGVGSLGSRPQYVASTPDFSRVLFESALNLTTGARGSAEKLYEWERATGTVRLAGVYPNESAATDAAAGGGHGLQARSHPISSDGRKVFFMAEAPAGVKNVYMRLDGTSTVQLNRSETASPVTPQSAQYWDASVSGSRVFFTTSAALTDDAPITGDAKLYMYDTTKPDTDPANLTYLSIDNEPTDPTSNSVDRVAGVSADGRTVYFTDGSQLVAGAPQLRTSSGMFVWHDGEISYIASVPGEDQSGMMQVSAGGDLVFPSSEPIGPTGYDHGRCVTVTGACVQLYVYRIATHELRCASCDPTGAPGEANAELRVAANVGGSAVIGHVNRIVTADGRRVFFTTADALVPEDVNRKLDAYQFDTTTGVVSLISSGHSTADSYFMETTPSGNDAFFITRERLVGWDVDDNYDLYDARIGGGFPEPSPPTLPCDALDCRGPLGTVPATGVPATAAVRSAGNVEGRLKARTRGKRRCRRGQVRKRVRGKPKCVNRGRKTDLPRHTAGPRRNK